MRVAVIDCGTNTFNLLIADLEVTGGWKRIFQISIPVKLTPGGPKKYISIMRIARAIDTLTIFKNNIINFRVDNVKAIATAAFRSSQNGDLLRQLAKEKTGIDLKIISGEEEAELIFYGVKASGLLDDKMSLIMDIGGGSTEFILTKGEELLWKGSFKIGVSRLFNQFIPDNPMSKENVDEIKDFIKSETSDLLEAIEVHKPVRLIGTAGSFNSLARMIYPKEKILPNFFKNNRLEISDFNKLYEILIGSSVEQRMLMSGLRPYRAAFIPIAVIKVNYILENSKIDEIHQTPFALKEGVLYKLQSEEKLE